MMVKVNKKKTASLDIDPQKGFTPLYPEELPVAGGETIADELNSQALFAGFRCGTLGFIGRWSDLRPGLVLRSCGAAYCPGLPGCDWVLLSWIRRWPVSYRSWVCMERGGWVR